MTANPDSPDRVSAVIRARMTRLAKAQRLEKMAEAADLVMLPGDDPDSAARALEATRRRDPDEDQEDL